MGDRGLSLYKFRILTIELKPVFSPGLCNPGQAYLILYESPTPEIMSEGCLVRIRAASWARECPCPAFGISPSDGSRVNSSATVGAAPGDI